MNQLDRQKLVKKLKLQHLELETDLTNALTNAQSENNFSGDEIESLLVEFKKDLITHLDLENNVFYADYIRMIKEQGTDLTDVNKFIAEMSIIGEAVMTFLNKYSNSKVISSNKTVFTQQLESIVSTLKMRISTEEDGVFDFYLLG